MSDAVIVPINYIEHKLGSSQYRLVGRRLTVEFLSTFLGDPAWTPERICETYAITPAELYAAWSFYYDHRAEIDGRIADAADAYDRALNTPEHQEALARLKARQGE
ncbi:MAG: DUF433 domain-containing protein [Chloroflexi bacterium]|nr:DUF433 domain-containing protein [Chloroflexota bacterium]